MIRLARMTLPIPRLVRLEVVERLRPATRQRSRVPVMRVIAIVDVSIKSMRPVEPGSRAKEDAAHKPVRTVIAVGRAVIRRVIEITIRANRRHADADRNLRNRLRRGRCCGYNTQRTRSQCDYCEGLPMRHDFSSRNAIPNLMQSGRKSWSPAPENMSLAGWQDSSGWPPATRECSLDRHVHRGRTGSRIHRIPRISRSHRINPRRNPHRRSIHHRRPRPIQRLRPEHMPARAERN